MNLQAPSWPAKAARPIRRVAKVAALSLLRLRHVLRPTPDEFIFINCPARSGSTLLSNILCGHPQIGGFGETMMIYRSSAHLSTLVAQVCWGKRQLRVRERYVLEKIVYSHLLPRPEVLNDAAISWIYLLRDPAASLASAMEYWSWTETRALNYYLPRLKRLGSDARHYAANGHRALFLTYEQLIAKPQPVLDILSRFLDLEGGLRPQYVRPRVRVPVGDEWSERIRSGTIVSQTRRYPVELSPAALEQARAAHAECAAVLRRHCEFVAGEFRRDATVHGDRIQ